MRNHRLLLLLLALLFGGGAGFATLVGRLLHQSAVAAAAARAVLETRHQILLVARYASDLVAARQQEQTAVEAELAQVLESTVENVNRGLNAATAEAIEALPTDVHGELHSSHRYANELWNLYREAVEAVLAGRATMRNRDFVVGSALELANRTSDIVRLYEQAQTRHLGQARTAGAGFLLFVAIIAGLAAWLLASRIFRPLRQTINQLKLMSSGELPLEAHMPLRRLDEFGELGHHFNLLVDRLRKADQTKDRFLATMSHEIRTPLNGVIGFIQNVAETEMTAQQRQYVRLIESSARALLHVLNEILDFSKLSSGKMTLEMVAFDLDSLVNDLTEVHRLKARAKNVRLRLDVEPWDSMVIRGDPLRLRQVLDNLLSNAVKFTEKGEIRLHIAFDQAGGDGGVGITFALTDTGVGITPEQQRQLFQPFAQAESATVRRYGGTGLGLFIAANLVSLMNGQIRVESQPGEGTRFWFRLVTVQAPPGEQVRLSENYTVSFKPGALKKFWALLVDDTPTNLFLMETICQNIGLPYMTAGNGKEAVAKVRQQRFDLIFMDIQMPVMDGYAAIREIRRIDSAAATQIVALTASAMQEDVEKALGAGSTGFLAKPFERNQLLLCIAEHLGVGVERTLRTEVESHESDEEAVVRRMYDFMREQYRISLGEIKLILAQSVADWRPQLDDLRVFSKKEHWNAVRAIMHRLKGQLGAIGLAEFAQRAETVNTRIKSETFAGLHAEIDAFVAELGGVFRAAEGDITLDAHTRGPASVPAASGVLPGER